MLLNPIWRLGEEMKLNFSTMDKSIKLKAEYPYVIICEGKDEYAFLLAYLDYLERNDESFIDCHNVINFGGITDVSQGLKNLKMYSKYEDMKGFLIIRDAEQDAKAAIDSVKQHVRQVWGLELDDTGRIKVSSDGMKVGFYLLPGMDANGNFENGTLEDLCLRIIDSDNGDVKEILSSAEKHMDELCKIRGKQFTWPHKNRLHLYFSSTDKYVGAKVGEATKWGAFDLSSSKLNQLKSLILQMQG